MYNSFFTEKVSLFIKQLPETDQAKIHASISFLEEGDFRVVYTKKLKGEIKELIVKRYRLVFFVKDKNIYFIYIFIKKTSKTPKSYLFQMEKVYKYIKYNI
ncbi:MAG: type II toxin-antitoxin system RelE/ParE family toxin [Candidatus Pacebacteria bacterium]|nr:type II toxin-antitoxin system RelE/ParE family toxin [Candidatus Paceibacterota bacterium]MCF7862669.1 type II toxin-antitoxin system RelE/ParE family toxin [Candidatus Paceibacterota bacterium]